MGVDAQSLHLEAGYPTARVAELSGLTYRQIDHYVRIGLLTPSGRSARGSGSYRIWTEADLSRAMLVAALRALGATTMVLALVLKQLPADPESWPAWLFMAKAATTLDDYLRTIDAERDSRPAEAMLADEIRALRAALEQASSPETLREIRRKERERLAVLLEGDEVRALWPDGVPVEGLRLLLRWDNG